MSVKKVRGAKIKYGKVEVSNEDLAPSAVRRRVTIMVPESAIFDQEWWSLPEEIRERVIGEIKAAEWRWRDSKGRMFNATMAALGVLSASISNDAERDPPSHRRARWLITRALNLKPRRRRRDERELRRVLAELDRYLMFWLKETRLYRALSVSQDLQRPDIPVVGDRALPLWAMDTLLALAEWAP